MGNRDVIVKPGIYDLDEDWYHQDFGPVPEGSLSVSGAKKLLPPSCPAIFEYERRNRRRRPSKAMELGTVVHGMVLGTGQDVEVLGYPDYKKKAAQDARDLALDEGRVPMLAAKYAEAEAIAQAVRDHPTAGALFSSGDPEQSGFWRDPEFGTWRRCRWDWITSYGEVADLKTCASASPHDDIPKAMHNFGYYMQNAWYRDGYEALFGQEPYDFLNVFVQTEPPYLVTIARLTDQHVDLGRRRCRSAIEKYRDCTERDVWPAWSDDIIDVSLPAYAERQIESEILHEFDY